VFDILKDNMSHNDNHVSNIVKYILGPATYRKLHVFGHKLVNMAIVLCWLLQQGNVQLLEQCVMWLCWGQMVFEMSGLEDGTGMNLSMMRATLSQHLAKPLTAWHFVVVVWTIFTSVTNLYSIYTRLPVSTSQPSFSTIARVLWNIISN